MKPVTILFLFLSFFTFANEELDCEQAWTTVAINQCMYKDLQAADELMEQYLAKSLERYSQDTVSLASIKKAQQAWLAYREEHCNAVYDIWRDGTIRGAMGLGCKLKLTHQRTMDLWQSFLTYFDSTAPLLPKPEPYEPKSY